MPKTDHTSRLQRNYLMQTGSFCARVWERTTESPAASHCTTMPSESACTVASGSRNEFSRRDEYCNQLGVRRPKFARSDSHGEWRLPWLSLSANTRHGIKPREARAVISGRANRCSSMWQPEPREKCKGTISLMRKSSQAFKQCSTTQLRYCGIYRF